MRSRRGLQQERWTVLKEFRQRCKLMGARHPPSFLCALTADSETFLSSQRATFVLPVVPPPAVDDAAVFVAGAGFMGPFFRGSGPIDLLCGRCRLLLGERLEPGQTENLVLRCPRCQAHNALISVPSLETFVDRLQSTLAGPADLKHLTHVLQQGQARGSSSSDIVAEIEQRLPDLGWMRDLLVPTNAGEFYALLAFLIAFLVWFQTKKQATAQPASVVVNNFFQSHDPPRKVGRNDICPCGSGRKFKQCHGRS